jgi:hypothetical protein
VRDVAPLRSLARALIVTAGLGLAAPSLSAQQPEPADTVRVPVPPEAVEPDTVPRTAQVPDTMRPVPALPAYPRARAAGFALGIWEWNGESLAGERSTTLVELLARVPGLLPTRAHGFGQPVGMSAFGLGGGRLRVFRDGVELDPFGASLLHLQHIGLVDVAGVRVVRGLHETRIELTTFRMPSSTPHSEVEAATGAPSVKLLRGLIARPVGERSALLAGFDLLDTRGPWEGPPSNLGYGALRWTRQLGSRAGAELEYRQAAIAFGEAGAAHDFSRAELLLRGRVAPAPGLAIDAVVGRMWREAEPGDAPGIDAAVNRAAVRAAYLQRLGWLEGELQARGGGHAAYPLPTADFALRAGLTPASIVTAIGEVRQAVGDAAASEFGATLLVGPLSGLSFFGSAALGSRTLGLARDSTMVMPAAGEAEEPDSIVVRYFRTERSELTSVRLGAEWGLGSARLAAAWVTGNANRVVPYGLPFDAGIDALATEAATGFEALASVPIAGGLRLEAAGSTWLGRGGRPYLPTHEVRAAAVFHGIFYTGNLEPRFRLEAVYRGSALVPDAGGTSFTAEVEPYTLFNAYVQIRVIDVRAFLAYENLLATRLAFDVPGAPLGPRAHYGVRWYFRN